MKKGILFTLSILLIASSFLYLTTILSNYSNSIKISSAALSELESITMQFDSGSFAIKQLFSNEAFNISIENNNVTLVLNTSKYSDYSSDILYLEQFLEFYSSTNISIDFPSLSVPTVYLEPLHILVNQTDSEMFIVPQSTNKILGYDFQMKIPAATPKFNWSVLNELPESNPNSMYFHLGLQGNNGSITTTKYLDKINPTKLQLLNQANKSIITISINNPASVTLTYTLPMYLKSIVRLNSSTYVELGTDSITVNTGSTTQKIGKVFWYEG